MNLTGRVGHAVSAAGEHGCDRDVARRDARTEAGDRPGGNDERQFRRIAVQDRADADTDRIDHWTCIPVPDVYVIVVEVQPEPQTASKVSASFAA